MIQLSRLKSSGRVFGSNVILGFFKLNVLMIFCLEYENVITSSPVIESKAIIGFEAGIGPVCVVCCSFGCDSISVLALSGELGSESVGRGDNSCLLDSLLTVIVEMFGLEVSSLLSSSLIGLSTQCETGVSLIASILTVRDTGIGANSCFCWVEASGTEGGVKDESGIIFLANAPMEYSCNCEYW
ncbi:hypothetical protein WICPIJ_008126 [Wickerhamomyces pijperi]|uniref:Uncharacterized protein n=1 Tax=Wickerhamomyces pijperi TaxID=599730 RepID=A0A9P8Q0T6_WICPI|nr:hypothetical protein WICPIJ_008126 [Wickerhamomyces pijperi]